jgi:hypothetical protein
VSFQKRTIVRVLSEGCAPAHLIRELQADQVAIHETATAPAKELRDVYSQRERAQKQRTDSSPKFRGFRALLGRLAGLSADAAVSVTSVDTPNYRIVIFTGDQSRTLLGTLYAKIEHNTFWREYVADREHVAYTRGVSDGISRAR